MQGRSHTVVILTVAAIVAIPKSTLPLPPSSFRASYIGDLFRAVGGAREEGGSPSNNSSSKSAPHHIRFDTAKCTREGEPVLSSWDRRFSNRVAFHIEELLMNWQISQSQSTDNWQGTLQDLYRSNQLQKDIRKQFGRLDVFQFFEDSFDRLSRAGFFEEAVKHESSSSRSFQHNFKEQRYLEVTTSIQGLLRDFAFVKSRNFTCEERMSWPLSWYIASPSNAGLPKMKLQIRAVPVRKETNGSYVIVKTASRIKWSILKEANMKFFEVNGFRAKVFADNNIITSHRFKKGQHSTYYYEVDEQLLNCSMSYEVYCMVRELYGEGRLCSNWGSRCGIRDVIKIDGGFSNGSKPSHILYAIGRPASAISEDGSVASLASNGREFLQRADNALASPGRATLASKKEASSMIDNMRSSRDYVPKLEQDQDVLTFLISVVTWAVEWIVSGPLWALHAWIILIRRILGRQQGILQEEVFQRREAGVFSHIRRQSLLILPAAVGLIPIVVGLVLAHRLRNASVGMMVGGYSVQKYDGVYDPDPKKRTLQFGLNAIIYPPIY